MGDKSVDKRRTAACSQCQHSYRWLSIRDNGDEVDPEETRIMGLHWGESCMILTSTDFD